MDDKYIPYGGGEEDANQLDVELHHGGSYMSTGLSSNRREILEHFIQFRRAIYEGPVSLINDFYSTDYRAMMGDILAHWPSTDVLTEHVGDDPLFLTLCNEIYFRYFYATKLGGISFEERQDSYVNYIDLFNLILAKDQPLTIELPDLWLWDIIEEFIYQFQSFCNFRTNLAKRSDDEVEKLRRNPKVWNIHAVLNVMHSLVDKSRIVEQLEAIKNGVSFNPGDDQICQKNLYKMLGYFSLIGLLKLHTLTSDYYMALKTIECMELDVNKQDDFCQVFHCIVATNYHAGFCYIMMRRLEDAIRVFVDTLLFIQRKKPMMVAQTFQNDAVNKKAEQMASLLSICLTINPIRIDENVFFYIRDKYLDKMPKTLLYTGPDGKMPFRDNFLYACPKFINPAPTVYEERNDSQLTAPTRHQVELFIEELQEQAHISDVRSYLKLYTTLSIDKLAGFMGKSPQEMKALLLAYKHKLSGDDTSEKKEEDFPSSENMDFYVDKDIIYIANTKITRRYSDYLVKQILKYEELTRVLGESLNLRSVTKK